VFQWIKRLFGARPMRQDATQKDSSQEVDYSARVPDSLKAYVERRKREISENYQRQLAAGALNSTSNEEAFDDSDEERKRAYDLMMQAKELFATGDVEGAIVNIEEASRIEQKSPPG
jgi:hypothetical protein